MPSSSANRALILIVASLLLAASSGAAARPQAFDVAASTDRAPKPSAASAAHVPGQVLVKLADGAAKYQVDGLARAQNALRVGAISVLGIEVMSISGDVFAAAQAYESSPLIEYAHPNYLALPHPTVPDGPYYKDGSQLNITDAQLAGASDFQRWYLNGALGAEDAWDLTQGDPGVVLAIIDSGVDLDHPNLIENIWSNPGEIPGNGIDDDQNGFVDGVNGWDFKSNDNDPNPDTGDGIDNDQNGAADDTAPHGTEVAGTAAARGNNGSGVAGASWNTKIMALKVFAGDGSTSFTTLINAIAYATANGADVINLSVGATGVDCTTESQAIGDAIDDAVQSGVTVIVAAGNDNSSAPSSPASCAGSLSVGATDHDSPYWTVVDVAGDPDGRASFSNYGTHVDVVAPGTALTMTSIFTKADENDGGAPAGTPAYIRGLNGTSFSAPLVAGRAGLIISRAQALGKDLSSGWCADCL